MTDEWVEARVAEGAHVVYASDGSLAQVIPVQRLDWCDYVPTRTLADFGKDDLPGPLSLFAFGLGLIVFAIGLGVWSVGHAALKWIEE